MDEVVNQLKEINHNLTLIVFSLNAILFTLGIFVYFTYNKKNKN